MPQQLPQSCNNASPQPLRLLLLPLMLLLQPSLPPAVPVIAAAAAAATCSPLLLHRRCRYSRRPLCWYGSSCCCWPGYQSRALLTCCCCVSTAAAAAAAVAAAAATAATPNGSIGTASCCGLELCEPLLLMKLLCDVCTHISVHHDTADLQQPGQQVRQAMTQRMNGESTPSCMLSAGHPPVKCNIVQLPQFDMTEGSAEQAYTSFKLLWC
jgi:hypothetical protein